jgi:hypothetical protein
MYPGGSQRTSQKVSKRIIANHAGYLFEAGWLDDGRTAAVILTTAGVYDRVNRRFLPLQEVIDALAPGLEPRALTPGEEAFVASHAGIRELDKGEGG